MASDPETHKPVPHAGDCPDNGHLKTGECVGTCDRCRQHRATDGGPRGRVTAVAPGRIWRGLSAAALGHACGHEGPLRRRGSVFGVSGAVHAG